ncbi:hypothetical protein WJX79_001188 [Trebouxia sp. C0005]
MQNALANSKCIARWTVNTFVWGPVRFLLVVVIWRFQPSDHGSKVPSDKEAVPLQLLPSSPQGGTPSLGSRSPPPPKTLDSAETEVIKTAADSTDRAAANSQPSNDESPIQEDAVPVPAQPAEPEAVAILSEMRQKVPIQDDSLHVRVTKIGSSFETSPQDRAGVDGSKKMSDSQPSNNESANLEDAITVPAQAAQPGAPVLSSEIPSKTRLQVSTPDDPFYGRVTKMASAFIDKVLRQEVERRGEVWSGVDIVPSSWNSDVRVLKDKSLMEAWEGTYGVAEYAEVRFQGDIIAAVHKTMKDTTEAAIVQQELDALHAVKGKAHILQEIDARFHSMGPGPIIIVTRLAEGITLEAAMALLWRERDTPAGMQKYKKAVKLIWRQVIQGVRALHCCGRSHTDLKPRNIHVYNWDDPSSLEVTILDLGSSVVQGQWNKRDWPAASTYFSSPEMLAAMSGLMQKGRYRKHLDFLAHDMWSLGLSGLML